MLNIKENNIQKELKIAVHCHYRGTICLFLILSLIFWVVPAEAVTNKAYYLYNLSNFNGPVLSGWVNIYVDKGSNDVYVVDPREHSIRIFENGMEVYIFGEAGKFGRIDDITVDGHGNMIILSNIGSGTGIILLNYRGERVSEIELKNLPPEFSGFRPNRIIYHEDKLYFADVTALRIAVTDMNGIFQTGYDIASIMNISDSKRDENEMTGLNIDRNGNILFTVAVSFQAFRLSLDGTIEAFGKSGGGLGTFGIVAGIVSDEKGFIYIADKLRCVVMIFNNDLEFLTEFGSRGFRPGNLIVPNDIDVDRKGRVYVSQAGGRGVSVFNMSHN